MVASLSTSCNLRSIRWVWPVVWERLFLLLLFYMSETFCRDIICFSVWLNAEGFRACSTTTCVVGCIKSAIYFSGWLLTTGKIKLKRKPTRAQQGEHGCNLSKVATYELASEFATGVGWAWRETYETTVEYEQGAKRHCDHRRVTSKMTGKNA